MSHRQSLSTSLCVLLGFVVASCNTMGTSHPQNTYGGEEGGEPTEHIGDPGLARELVMEDMLTERGEDGRLTVQFNLRSTRSTNLPIEWTLVWLDERGFRLDTPHHWTPAILGGTTFESIARTSPTPDASGFQLHVRRPSTVR